MRYQQKQKQELEQKRNELLGSRGLAPLDSPTDNGRIHIGNGKVSKSLSGFFYIYETPWISIPLNFQVRQMFDERRQRVTGIDKSYPLQPITTRPMPNTISRPVKATTVMKFFPHFVRRRRSIICYRYQTICRRQLLFFFFNCVPRICDDLLHCTQSDPLNAGLLNLSDFLFGLIADIDRKAIRCQLKSKQLFQLHGETIAWLQWWPELSIEAEFLHQCKYSGDPTSLFEMRQQTHWSCDL